MKNLVTRPRHIESALSVYIKNLTPYTALSAEEEQRLGKLLVEGSAQQRAEARDQLILHNLRLVVFVAKRFRRKTGISIEDLIQDGNVGLCTAVEKFDYTQGFRFSTYAFNWIEREIKYHIAEYQLPVHIPLRQYSRLQGVKAGGTPEEGFEILEVYAKGVQSLDEEIDEDANTRLALIANKDKSLPGKMFTKDLTDLVVSSLVVLSEKERYVITNRYDLFTTEPRSQEDLSKELKVTRQRVCSLEKSALQKLQGTVNNQLKTQIHISDFME